MKKLFIGIFAFFGLSYTSCTGDNSINNIDADLDNISVSESVTSINSCEALCSPAIVMDNGTGMMK